MYSSEGKRVFRGLGRVLDTELLWAAVKGLDPLLFFIPFIWLVFIISRLLPVNQFGLIPRRSSGLIGVVSMPLLHEDFKHLMANTVPLALLLALLFNTEAGATTVAIMTQVLGGLLLWVCGRRANHIGASLMVFALTGFHIANGLVQVKITTVAIALLVAALYGTTFLTSINPWKKGSSWDGHLCGFIAGAAVAVLFANDYYRVIFPG